MMSFTGSANFSVSALFSNVETISCDFSWVNDSTSRKRIAYYEDMFEKTWDGQYSALKVIPIENVQSFIEKSFPVESLDELVREEEALIKKMQENEQLSDQLVKQLKKVRKHLSRNTRAQIKIPDFIDVRPYQEEAINNWQKNGYQGLFEMATGTGKTITALIGAIRLGEETGKLVALILVPTISLAEQWKEELQSFHFTTIVSIYSGNPKWYQEAKKLLNSFKIGSEKYPAIVATYASYTSNEKFKEIVNKLPGQTLLIGDEAHNMGAAEVKNNLPDNIHYRLGLTATPHRHFDEAGTRALLKFFNAVNGATFEFGLSKAIKEGYLSQYKLYPHFAELNEEEFEEYVDITNKIARKVQIVDGKIQDMDPSLERLFRERRKLLNTARDKIRVLGEIIDQMQDNEEVHHTLVYCPEGSYGDRKIIHELGSFLAHNKGLKIGHFTGDTPPKRREELLTEFDQRKIQCLLSMKCLDEGVDVKKTETAIFLASTTNPRQYIQRRGRVLRTHSEKPLAFLHDVITVPPILSEENEVVQRVEKTILKQEFRRYMEFAENSLNYVEALNPVKDLANQYDLNPHSL